MTTVRISSAMAGQSSPHRVWRVDVPREVLKDLSQEDHHVRLVNDHRELLIQFGDHGALLDEHGEDHWVSAGSISDRHLEGLGGAMEDLPAWTAQAQWDPEAKALRIQGQLHRVIGSAMVDLEELREQVSPEAHFPARHFPEDITDQEIK